MKLNRGAKGYGAIGVSWSFTPLGHSIALNLGRISFWHHWQTRANRRLLENSRRGIYEKTNQ